MTLTASSAELARGTRVRLLNGACADQVGEVVYCSNERPRLNPYPETMYVVRVGSFLTNLLRRTDLEPVSD